MTFKEIQESKGYVPEYIRLWLSDGREVEGLLLDERPTDTPDGISMYDIRHSDEDAGRPATIEPVVYVNRYGTIALERVIKDLDDYIGIREWSVKTWDEHAETVLHDAFPDAAPDDIELFIDDIWENLDTDAKNLYIFQRILDEEKQRALKAKVTHLITV